MVSRRLLSCHEDELGVKFFWKVFAIFGPVLPTFLGKKTSEAWHIFVVFHCKVVCIPLKTFLLNVK